MRLEPDQFWTYFEWLFQHNGLLDGFLLAVILSVVGFIISYLVAVARFGPGEGFLVTAKVISDLFRVDLPRTSLRRITAIGRLAFKEAIRRRVLAVVGIFMVVLMFAGWFLDPSADYPAQLYLSFVLTSTNYLVLLLGLFLSAFSLPADIKNRTIYTIVTKPVRPTEIFLGRVFGFAAIGTLILVFLCGVSYAFVVRGLKHTHVADERFSGVTTFDAEHSHSFVVGDDGQGFTDEKKGHKHEVNRVQKNGKTTYEFGPPVGDLVARIPIYGELRFVDPINVGHESTYKKHVEGAKLSSAIWTFKNLDESRFRNGLELQMTLAAFRTYKGDIKTGVRGAIILRNPDGSAESDRIPFIVKEFQVDQKQIALKRSGFKNGLPSEIDVFKDLAPKGELEVVIRCLDASQYLGMAQADLFLRAGERPFWQNFIKGYVSIWLQMVIVICLGVMYSTFLTGPTAMVATIATLVLGFFGSQANDIFSGKQVGGGPVESLIRIVSQEGAMADLDLGSTILFKVVKNCDFAIMYVLSTLTSAVPNFIQLDTANFVAYGINLFGGLLARHLTITLGYLLLTSIVGYFFLKTREMAA